MRVVATVIVKVAPPPKYVGLGVRKSCVRIAVRVGDWASGGR